MRKSHLVTRAALLAALLVVGHAGAAPVTVTLTDGSWGLGGGWGGACSGAACDEAHSQLNVGWSVDGDLAGTSFQLDSVGDTRTVRFGSSIFAEEDGTISADETDGLALSALLHFSAPTLGLTNNTAVVSATVGLLKELGSLNKELQISFESVLLGFADGGEIGVDFSPMTWNCQGTGRCTYRKPADQWVDVSFTLLRASQVTVDLPLEKEPARPIPEPSSLALLGVGLVGLGFGRRRSQHAAHRID